MYLFVFVCLAWLLTAPAMAVLIGKVVSAADRRAHRDSVFARFEAEIGRGAPRPAAGHQ